MISQFPPNLLEAIKGNRLIVFIGSGLSCAVGLPSWNEVRDDLIAKFRLKSGYSEDIRNEYKQMDFYDCFESIRTHDETIYKEIIAQSLQLGENIKTETYKRWFGVIRSWGPAAIISTNIDDLMVNYSGFRSDHFRYKKECSPQELQDNKIFLIHGNRTDSVWTVDYRNSLYDEQCFRNFLWNVFGSYSVLFIGTSFREKWLEFARLSTYMRNKTQKPSHYALTPSDESHIPPTHLKDFFGIEVIQFENSDGSYKNFGTTIEAWELTTPSIGDDDITRASKGLQL